MNNNLWDAITLHKTLNGYRQGRRVGTATMEEKLDQQLAGIVPEPLFQVIIDVQKAYYYLDRGICMEIIMGYGHGNNLQMLLQRYWDKQKVVPKARNSFGRPFWTEKRVTQGDPVSLNIFNIVMDAVVS